MNFINSNFSTSFFRHFAAALSAPGGKTVAGNEGRGEGSAVSILRDKLTLSPEGRSAYTAYTNKLNKTEQSASTTETQDESAESFVSSDVSDAGNKSFNDVVSEVLAVNQNVENVQANSETPSTTAQVSASAVGVRNFIDVREDGTAHNSRGISDELREKLRAVSHSLNSRNNTGLTQIEGTDWHIADGAEALVGHEILGMLEGMFAKSGGRVNEYGFYIDMPGSYNGVICLTSEIVESPEISAYIISHLGVRDGWAVREDGRLAKKVPVPAFMPDGSFAQTFTPEVSFRDATGLGGMSLTDRKQFLASAQKIIDSVLPGMDIDARQFTYSIPHLSDADRKNGALPLLTITLTITNNIGGMLSDDQRDTLQQALNQNRQLFEMKHRADQSSNKGVGEFTMSVLDANGNALAKDQIRLISGNKSVITSVDSIKDMDQQEILGFISRQ